MTGVRERILAVSAVLTRGAGNVLLVRRGQPPHAGRWSLPGGRALHGESLAACAARELLEETGLVVAPLPELPLVARLEVGSYDLHVVLVGAYAPTHGVPVAGSDALEARFHALASLREDDVTPGLLDVLRHF